MEQPDNSQFKENTAQVEMSSFPHSSTVQKQALHLKSKDDGSSPVTEQVLKKFAFVQITASKPGIPQTQN